MVFETVALSVITVLLLLLTLTRKAGRVKLLLALLTALAAVVSMVLFILMRHSSGGPDQGQEAFQMYVPCAFYLLAALFSLLMAALSRRKLRMDRAAKTARREDSSKREDS